MIIPFEYKRWKLLRRYWVRWCTGTEWRERFPGVPKEEIREFLGLDSLGYLSLGGMLDCMGEKKDCFCTACYNGVYPTDVQAQFNKEEFETRVVRTVS